MIWHLIGVFVAGLACGGIAYMLVILSKGRLPKWSVPVGAGAGMMGLLLMLNYSWYEDKLDQLAYKGVDVEVIETKRETSFFKPWGYIYPAISQFSFLDGSSLVSEQKGQRLVQFAQYTFYQEYKDRVETHFFLLNCNSKELVETDQQGELLANSQF